LASRIEDTAAPDYGKVHKSCRKPGRLVHLDSDDIRKVLEAVAASDMTIEEAVRGLATMPFLRVGDVSMDTHRHLRRGIAEAVYGESKSPAQIRSALAAAIENGSNCVVTRLPTEVADAVMASFPELATDGRLAFDEIARMMVLRIRPVDRRGRGYIAVVSAGASDLPVAEEAALALETAGDPVVRVRDVGVAGIHRLSPHLETIRGAAAVIVVAGMEGALPGVVAGLGPAPVIGVPTSVGYGTAFAGLTALLAMLNSCAGGVTVVNIDNGYGAAVAAHLINSDRPLAAGCDR